jgi:hypothetical protein
MVRRSPVGRGTTSSIHPGESGHAARSHGVVDAGPVPLTSTVDVGGEPIPRMRVNWAVGRARAGAARPVGFVGIEIPLGPLHDSAA